MYVVVPLAGPDFVLPNGQVKATLEISGKPVLLAALNSRPWAHLVHTYIFVLYECSITRSFYHSCLSSWFPGCQVIFIPSYTIGAAFSVLPALSLIKDIHSHLVVDLADILYTSVLDLPRVFSLRPNVGGIALTFASSRPEYSYLQISSSGYVIEAAEKLVISNNASAGTYIYRDVSIYLAALSHAILNNESQTFNGLFYVCPLFNGVISASMDVILENVCSVIDLKSIS